MKFCDRAETGQHFEIRKLKNGLVQNILLIPSLWLDISSKLQKTVFTVFKNITTEENYSMFFISLVPLYLAETHN